MGAAFFIARVLGPCCLVVAAGIILNREHFQRVLDDYCKNATLVFLGGMMALILGIVVVLVHNVWSAHWSVMITIYGWCGIVKGVWLIVFPRTVPAYMEAYKRNKKLWTAHVIALIIFGVALTNFGYLSI